MAKLNGPSVISQPIQAQKGGISPTFGILGDKKPNSKINNKSKNLDRQQIKARREYIIQKLKIFTRSVSSTFSARKFSTYRKDKMMNGNKNHELPKAQTKALNGLKTNGTIEIEENDPKSKNGEIKKNPEKTVSNSNVKPNVSSTAGPPVQTFENAPFKELMSQYEGVHHKIQPTIELQQALMMSTNFKEAAAIVNGTQITGNGPLPQSNQLTKGDKVGSAPDGGDAGASYYYKQDYLSDLSKKCQSKDFAQVSKLLTNIGANDKASNWLLEQKTLQRALTSEGKDLRDLIESKTVDQLEYVRIKENITQAKKLLDDGDVSDCEQSQKDKLNTDQKLHSSSPETQDDSGSAKVIGNTAFNDKRITSIIKQIRQSAQQHLGHKDGRNYEKVPLTTICKKLRQESSFIKKRDQKNQMKGYGLGAEHLQKSKEQLMDELKAINDSQESLKKREIFKKIQSIESVLGLEKRLKTSAIDKTVAEIDMKPMTAKAFDIQNILFDYCGINLQNSTGDDSTTNSFSNQKRIERMFGKIRKLPKKSCLLANFEDNLYDNFEERKEPQPVLDAKKQGSELVKVIGLEPHKLFEKIPKYKIQIDRMPKFSNNFDTVDSVIPGIQNKSSVPGQSILNPINSNMSFQRIDGRQVISLQFNPYFIDDDLEKKKIYDSYMKEILDQRDKIKNAPKEAKNKQEAQNIKRAWQNIVKKDIPKAYRMYQKFKADQENNNKKLSQNCLKEVRKRAVRTQRMAKESVMRARKLTKEMAHFWRKRDKEMADTKRKREKLDKEQKKRQQEEEEAMLQKKRLEYLMSQSEIYAHFMATKLGVSEDLVKEKHESTPVKRVDVDQRAARIHIAGMINDNRKRLDDFDDHDRDEIEAEDLEQEKLDAITGDGKVVKPPKIFSGDLKAYQLKGLQWLDNLYDQGINGILADEMGLGKTIQTIALLAHLAEKKNVWGPFLIVVPVTTLHNWQNELAKFCPALKVLPYFGSAEERKKLAKFLDPKNLYNPAMCIHVLITSYNLIVGGGKDQLRLQRVKWHYMILDEAQAVKNCNSRRWKTLLSFNTRNRLLLSGTPIQNSMAELWALLHFIMPQLFDNHDQFQEWFSKDIEQHSMDQGELNKHQLKRLHLILQPFMLRRLKKDVEQEIAPKTEEMIQCIMTFRQRILYDRIKRKISAQDLFMLASSKAKVENLMNLVMQFRKVCNHPDLFERRIGRIPFVFSKMQHGMLQNMSLVTNPNVMVSTSSPICFVVPKMVYDECFLVSDNNTNTFTQQRKGIDVSMSSISVDNHFKLFNIFNEKNLHDNIYGSEKDQNKNKWNNSFSAIGLLMRSNNWGYSDIAYQAVSSQDRAISTVALLHFYSKKAHKNTYMNILGSEKDTIEMKFGQFGMVYEDQSGLKYSSNENRVDIIVTNFVQRDNSLIYRPRVFENLDLEKSGDWDCCEAMVPTSEPLAFLNYSYKFKTLIGQIFYAKCVADTIGLWCNSTSFLRYHHSVINNPNAKKALCGKDFKPAHLSTIGRIGKDKAPFALQEQQIVRQDQGPPTGFSLTDTGLLDHNYAHKGSCTLQLPDLSRMVTDCSKMQVLQDLLAKKFANGNRCLIFCQMTRMMDILEDFLIWQKYTYFRMDGSTQLQDRRFMVEEFQSNPNIFIFILSTRAGGLGINLIAADTVIFYDNDWNPTMDSQATDRAHRIGQTKKVNVYRLVTKSSVEERILQRARQKESVQSTVYGANLKADSFSTRDVVDMIIDDIDDPLNNLGGKNQVKGFIKSGGQGQQKGKKKKKKKAQDGGQDGGLYESIRKIKTHDKFENEIDDLLKDTDLTEVVKDKKDDDDVKEIVSEPEDEDGSDEEDQAEHVAQALAQAKDRKKALYSLLEKSSSGATKQVFNFEEEDIGANLNGTLNNQKDALKRDRGRPGKSEKKAMEMELDEEDEDEYGDEEN